MTKKLTTLAIAALLGSTAPVLAQSQGDMTLGLGAVYVNPTDSFSAPSGVRVGENIRPSLTFEYFVMDNVGIEVLAAWPFKHDLQAAGAGNIGSTKQLPPTVSLQYYFTNSSIATPFVGAGLNYTNFWDAQLDDGTPVSLADSWGFALHAGVDVAISPKGSLRVDVRYIDINTKATIAGAPAGSVKLDPWAFGASYIFKF
ncbi:Outer membrane protein W precursor [hydrothermal vent metagenome]|uniref:Outer membrane protein W n=1 Tax=hydrothermal vent metagenome TaxID=652676 RepID=A0A3B0RJJ6_9ZZZZ